MSVQSTLYPLAAFSRIENANADAVLDAWGHYLGPCDRPFKVQSFGLTVCGRLCAVAVSASTVSTTVEGVSRYAVVELARLCAAPEHRDMTRVALRLWRKVAAEEWLADNPGHWQSVDAYVSYSNSTRHAGDVYRFDGWRRAGDRRGSTGGGSHTRHKAREDKVLWMYDLTDREGQKA